MKHTPFCVASMSRRLVRSVNKLEVYSIFSWDIATENKESALSL